MEATERVAVHVVLAGHVPRMPDALKSLEAQSSHAFRTVVADHGATEGGRPWLEGRPDLIALRRRGSQDVLRDHNDLLALTRSRWDGENADQRFVLFLAQGVWLEATALEELLRAFDADPTLHIAGPGLSYAEWALDDDGEREQLIPHGKWASVGFDLTKARRVRLRMAGQPDTEAIAPDEVFGFPLTAVMVRMSALERLKTSVGWFDEALGPGLAAVDLAWRAKRLGLRARLVPGAHGWVRPLPLPETTFWSWLRHWYGHEARAQRVANAGWLLVRLKNERVLNALGHFPWTIWNWVKGIVAGVADPLTGLRSFGVFFQVPRALRLRREVGSRATIGPDEMWRWFV